MFEAQVIVCPNRAADVRKIDRWHHVRVRRRKGFGGGLYYVCETCSMIFPTIQVRSELEEWKYRVR